MTKLRDEMTQAMKLKKFSDKTQESYLYQITKLAGHYGKSPDELSPKKTELPDPSRRLCST
ncbi:phage integrase N-terminal SAM-like domain-containing protein [Desulfocicer niacini]